MFEVNKCFAAHFSEGNISNLMDSIYTIGSRYIRDIEFFKYIFFFFFLVIFGGGGG